MKARNKIAEEFVGRERIAVDDLYGLVQDHPEYWSADGVHFNSKGIDVQAEQVSQRIAENLKYMNHCLGHTPPTLDQNRSAMGQPKGVQACG